MILFSKRVPGQNTKLTVHTVKLGDKEQIGVKEPFPVTNLPVYFIRIRDIWH